MPPSDGKPRPPLARMVRHLRHVEDRTLRELGKEIGVSAATLMRVEQGYAMDATTFLRVVCWMTGQRLE